MRFRTWKYEKDNWIPNGSIEAETREAAEHLLYSTSDLDDENDWRAISPYEESAPVRKIKEMKEYEVWSAAGVVYIKYTNANTRTFKTLAAAKREMRAYINSYSHNKEHASMARSQIQTLTKEELVFNDCMLQFYYN